MPTYRSLLFGCGGRAPAHAQAYRELRNIELIGVCDRVEERREAFRQTYEVPAAYADYETALAELQPDIVHIVTCPGHRVWEIGAAAKAGVKAVIVEKPLAIKPGELAALDQIHAETGLKIITNCQRRYYPQFRDGVISEIVREKLGEVYCVRASTRGNTMGMGPHMMDLLLLFLGETPPEAVWAMAHTINEEDYQATHQAPESIFAQYWFPNGVRVFFDCSPDALGTPGETSFWMHLHFDFLGTKGRLYLTQNNGYWYQSEGMAVPIHGESSWDEQEPTGQRDFTQAVADWLDGGPPHLNRYELHRQAVLALLGAQKSVYEGTKVSLPCEFTDEEWLALRERLRGT
ncbi:MAG: Gfo/Idh/MocA family oxidoreductase [Armatimonadetes bacterium]|jgi:predicted dehydrogenase|nr:Gfo/Idh/MocA family oxidoreductase [Armatimonadota bacterium]